MVDKSSFIIRDLRQKDHFTVDDLYLNGYARYCGIHATGVYMALCRHANFENQQCFPSLKTIAYKLGISKSSVLRALKVLVQYNIITIERNNAIDRGWLPNIYFLMDKRVWVAVDNSKITVDNL